jgi:rhodanese-related sulfurtransferase
LGRLGLAEEILMNQSVRRIGAEASATMIWFPIRRRNMTKAWKVILVLFAVFCFLESQAKGQPPLSIYQATLMEADPKTPEISTEEMQKILEEKTATVLDTRPFREFTVSHIPGAMNVSGKPGVAMSLYVSDVAEIDRILKGDKKASIVLYCNGPFCGKSKRLAEELRATGYANVRRYQLGIPVWRALVGVTVIEPEGVRYVLENDRTAVFIDSRDPDQFKAGSLPLARNLPGSGVLPGKDVGEVKKAKDDGRLPMEDHNTRIIVFGKDESQTKLVAEALAREAFHNVSYFAGNIENLQAALRAESASP